MPFFGIPIRNGLPIGLGSVAGFGVAPEFSPADLFLGGVNGAWYDPSDSTTLFSDTAGTTPVAQPGAGAQVVVGRMLDKSGNANHAQAYNSTTARPELSARVNLLTYSEQFDNAAWTKGNAAAATTTATTDPLGGTTADTLTEDAATNIHRAFQEASLSTANVTVTASISLKANTRTKAVFGVGDNSDFRFYAAIDLSAGTITQSGVAAAAAGASLVSANISSQGNGWYRVTLTGTTATGQTRYFVNVAISTSDTPGGLPSYAGNGTSGIYIWGAQLTATNAFPANTYQRIADQYTYDNSASFPRYLRFDGVDDGMSTPANLNLSSTDKATVFAGVRRLANAADEAVTEFSAAWSLNNGAFILANVASGSQYSFDVRGTSSGFNAVGTYAPPITSVRTGLANIGASTSVQRVNGVQVSAPAVTLGTGNFGTYPLYIGSRNNASLRFNGNIYSLIVRGAATDASTISATETWVAGKTGITI